MDLVSGFAFKSELFTNNPEDVHLVKGENLHQGYIDWKNAKRWKANEFTQYERFQLNKGDVVLAMDRPWIEAGLKFSWIKKDDPKALLVQRVARMRGANGLSTSYLRYIIGSSQFTDYIKPIVTGVNVPHISGQQIKDFKFLLPPYPIQCRIASTLAAYDDLIDKNTRRIQILEEIARRIYEEWFVRFRFPGHENVRMVESELGLIPSGWEIDSLGSALVLQRGFDLPVANRKPGEYPVFAATGLNGTHTEAKVKAPGIVTGRSGSLGVVNFIDEDFWPLNTTLWVKEFRRVSAWYAFYLLGYMRLEQYNSGAAVPTLNRNDIHGLPVLIPSPKILNQFDSLMMPIFRFKRLLNRSNDILRRTRDLLLPKLISGEIDVSNFPEPE